MEGIRLRLNPREGLKARKKRIVGGGGGVAKPVSAPRKGEGGHLRSLVKRGRRKSGEETSKRVFDVEGEREEGEILSGKQRTLGETRRLSLRQGDQTLLTVTSRRDEPPH